MIIKKRYYQHPKIYIYSSKIDLKNYLLWLLEEYNSLFFKRIMTCQFRSMFVLRSSDAVFSIFLNFTKGLNDSAIWPCVKEHLLLELFFRAASCRGIRKKGEETEALAHSKENKDDCNKITTALILLPILLHKKVSVKICRGNYLHFEN